MGYIYKITNMLTNKVYIGKTEGTIEQRFEEHKKAARNNVQSHLYNSMRKYDFTNFIIEQVEECDNDILNAKESY